MPTFMRALRRRSFALLWSGQSISILGDRAFQIALAWWVVEETGSAAAMATVFILGILPMLVFLLVGGVLVDRFPRVRLMLISDLVRAVAVGLTAVLAFAGALELWHLYALSLVSGAVEAFFVPAYRAAVPEIVPPADLTSANSLTSLSDEVIGIAGPALGAGIVALGGTPVAFGLNAVSFLVSAGCLLPLLGQATAPGREEASPGLFADLGQGLAAVAASPWLWVTIAVAGLSNIAYSGPMEVALPFVIADRYGGQVGVLGLFSAASSLGAVLAAIVLGRLPVIRRRGIVLYGSWLLVGVFMMVIGLPIGVPVLLAIALLIGVCNATLGLVWVNTLQEQVPRHLFGRVSSVDYLGSYLLLPVGYAVGGWAAGVIGPALLFIVGGAIQAALVASGLLHPRVRAMD